MVNGYMHSVLRYATRSVCECACVPPFFFFVICNLSNSTVNISAVDVGVHL
jgi:hypothetical protein